MRKQVCSGEYSGANCKTNGLFIIELRAYDYAVPTSLTDFASLSSVPESAGESHDLTVSEWLTKILIDWELTSTQLASLLHADQTRVEAELAKPIELARSGATIPAGLDAAPALVRIYQLLATLHPKNEDQVKWLFSGNQDFGGEKPIDVAVSSQENIFWLAYYLEGARTAEALKSARIE